MKVAFRVDASSLIGSGHFMRCLTLADELKRYGAVVRFVSRHLPQHMRDLLVTKQLEFDVLDSTVKDEAQDELPHANWLGVSQKQDATDTMRALADVDWDWLIVDHYALDCRWESGLRCLAKKILVIDDLADRQHDCDLLLDQNLYYDMNRRYAGRVPLGCNFLLGPRYALLRDEYRQLRAGTNPRNESVKRILVFFGGVDADNFTGRAIEVISGVHIANLEVDVVIGSQNPAREKIIIACAKLGWACHVQTDRMAALMAEADLAIGAGGSAIWERCCLGLPTLTFCTADNQKKQIADAARAGLLYSPELNDDLGLIMQRHMRALMECGYLRQHISSNGKQVVDGHGAARVAAMIRSSGIQMRAVHADDSEKIFQWRNHPAIREFSRNPGIFDWQEHQRWFAAMLADADNIMLVGQLSEFPVGIVRFDVQGVEAEVSIYLVPQSHSAGLGQGLLHAAEKWLLIHRPQIRKIRAHILGANETSQKLFVRAGYRVESSCYLKEII